MQKKPRIYYIETQHNLPNSYGVTRTFRSGCGPTIRCYSGTKQTHDGQHLQQLFLLGYSLLVITRFKREYLQKIFSMYSLLVITPNNGEDVSENLRRRTRD